MSRFSGSDGAQDVRPSGIEGITEPIHALSLIAMGVPIFDNLDLEAVGREAAKRKTVGLSRDGVASCRAGSNRFGAKSDRDLLSDLPLSRSVAASPSDRGREAQVVGVGPHDDVKRVSMKLLRLWAVLAGYLVRDDRS